jgi:hypothetical protein
MLSNQKYILPYNLVEGILLGESSYGTLMLVINWFSSENVGLVLRLHTKNLWRWKCCRCSRFLLIFNIQQVLFSNLEVKILMVMEYMTKMMLVQKLLV